MEALGAIRTVVGAIQYPINMIKEDNLLSIQLKGGLRSIFFDLEMMEKKVEEYDELQLQELAYEIEDFTECLWSPGALGPVLSAIGKNPKTEHLERIKHFQDRIKDLKTGQQKIPELGSSAIISSTAGLGESPHAPKEDLVGTDKPIKELVELLPPLDVLETQLKVVSIVGCQGVGKTAIARAVYEDYRLSSHFDIVAWVVASQCSQAEDLLNEVSKALRTVAGDTTSSKLHDILKNKRYLVFIDDVKVPVMAWKHTVDNGFPMKSRNSRIIMTTSVRSVAAACSSGCYVYTMPRLGQDDSERLFWRKVYGGVRNDPAPALVNSSETILSKCDGLPLAIISVANDLSTKGGQSVEHLNSSDCEKAGETVSAFGEMGRALMQCYDSLPDCHHKNCLLYLSIFPMGQVVKMKSVVRRLKSEGLGGQDSNECFKKLVDQCFVEPVQSCWNSKDASRCQVHGVMLEYIIKLAMSRNLVTVCQENKTLPIVDDISTPRVRRLSIQSRTVQKYSRPEDIRSLTLFNGGLFNVISCKMLRLLDLEGCKHVGDGSLNGICELRLLRYLSLRNTKLTNLPSQIEKLERLQTLDIRDTDSSLTLDLPWEVIMLPKLAYLYGKFKLNRSRGTKQMEEFLSIRSQLHTLAGLVASSERGIENFIIGHATSLKKIKLCYAPDLPSYTPPPVPSSNSDPVPCAPSSSSARPHSADPTSSAFASAPPSITLSPAPSSSSAGDIVPSAPAASSTRYHSAYPNPTSNPPTTYIRAPALAQKKRNTRKFLDRIYRFLTGKRPVASPDPNPPTRQHENLSLFVDSWENPIASLPPTENVPASPSTFVPAPAAARSSDSAVATSALQINIIDLIPSIEQRFNDLESVFLDSSILITEDFLVSVLKGPSTTIRSIKLQGQLQAVPNSSILEKVPQLNKLRKLQLLSTGLSSEDLSVLQSLCYLEYLKLVEDPHGFMGGNFTVRRDGFRSLMQLWFQGPTLPKLKFEEGAMEALTSLQLLCPDSNHLQETATTMEGITHAKYLNDVVLHHSANTDTQDCWKKAIQKHPHRPCVKKQPEPKHED